MATSRPLRVLIVLGQRPGMTGSGVVLRELWDEALKIGDLPELICAGYPDDPMVKMFGECSSVITFSNGKAKGELSFQIPGMSDGMPYSSIRYRDMAPDSISCFLEAFRNSISNAVRDYKPHIIHVHHLWILLGLVKEWPHIPAVVTIHGSDLKLAESVPHLKSFVCSGVQNTSFFMPVSHDVAALAREVYDIPGNLIEVIGNGYNPMIFNIDGMKESLYIPTLLCAGKFVSWKGFVYMIRACAGLRGEWRLIFAGEGPEEELRAVKHESQELGISKRVKFLGHLPQERLATLMRSARLFVLPSVMEPFGLVLLEALACGCPVVAAAAGGPRDIVTLDLQRAGVATLIPPLQTGDPDDEKRYVRDLRNAIQRQLDMKVKREQRAQIAASVVGREWREIYALVRRIYTRVLE